MATVEKAEIKILTANNIGADLENLLEGARKHRDQSEGAKQGLASAAKAVATLAEFFRKETGDEGEVKIEGMEEPEIRALVLRYIARATGLLENMAGTAQTQVSIAEGMIAAYARAMTIPEKMIAQEKLKAAAVVESESGEIEGEIDPRRPSARVNGVHPGNPLEARRANGHANGAKKRRGKRAPDSR